MEETKKTLVFVGTAVVLMVLALIFAPNRITPEAFLDQGEKFFPSFTNPNDALTLEVISFDEAAGGASPFKVTFANGRWTIPSHHNYPADAKERLAQTAANIIDIAKDDFRSDNIADQELCGVIDPLDETAGLTGRGQRVTIKGQSDVILADIIVGKAVEGREGFRFVRSPDSKRVYAARMKEAISTNFADWIETDLLQVDQGKIDRVELRDYSVDERTFSVQQRDNLILTLQDGMWKWSGMKSTQAIDSAKMKSLLTTLDELQIIGVRPKPEGLSASLTGSDDRQQISQSDFMSLQSKGFYIARDGRLLSNEGELKAHTKEGVLYTLRFGEVVYGSGLAVTAGAETDTSAQGGSAQNRYLFITTEFDESTFSEPKKPISLDFQTTPDSLWTDEQRRNKELQDVRTRWEANVARGKDLNQKLNERFAGWYYVISNESFGKLHLTKNDLLAKKDSDKASS